MSNFVYFSGTYEYSRAQEEYHDDPNRNLLIFASGCSGINFTQKDIKTYLPLFQYFAEHGRVPSKDDIDSFDWPGIRSRK